MLVVCEGCNENSRASRSNTTYLDLQDSWQQSHHPSDVPCPERNDLDRLVRTRTRFSRTCFEEYDLELHVQCVDPHISRVQLFVLPLQRLVPVCVLFVLFENCVDSVIDASESER